MLCFGWGAVFKRVTQNPKVTLVQADGEESISRLADREQEKAGPRLRYGLKIRALRRVPKKSKSIGFLS